MQINFKNIIYPIIILLLVTSSSIFYNAYRKSTNDIRGLTQKISELEKENQELKRKPPLEWKEYSDDTYKFKIWYPEKALNYKIFVYEEDVNNKSFILNDQSLEALGDMPVKLLSIIIYNDNASEMKKFIQEELKGELEKSVATNANADKYSNNLERYITQEKIDNIDVYKVELPENIISYYIKRDNSIFVLRFNNSAHTSELSDKLKSYFDQMIQSFRFIE